MISKLIGKTIVAGAVLGCIILTPDVFGQANRGKGIRVFSGTKNQAVSVQRGANANQGQGFGMIHNATRPCFIDSDGDGACDRHPAHAGMMRRGGMGMRNCMGIGMGMGMENCMGMGRGFVDADNDGVNDNSPLAKLDLTDEQKQKIAALRESGPGPHFEELKSILTEEQLTQLQALKPIGAGRGFVDANNDGINDNSPLAQLNLTDEQKQKIAALRESGPGPHFEELKSILTEEQLAQLETIRVQRQAERQANCPGMGTRQGRGGCGMGFGGRK